MCIRDRHKAFQYWEADGLLAVPMSTNRWSEEGYEYISKLQLINAKPGENLTIYNEVDHSDFYKPNYWWDNTDIRRSIFMDGGNYIYAISEKAVTAHNVETMERTGFAELPSNNKPTFVDYYEVEVEANNDSDSEKGDKDEEETESEDENSNEEGEGDSPPQGDSS